MMKAPRTPKRYYERDQTWMKKMPHPAMVASRPSSFRST